jgi:hypothetical protein
MQRICGINRRFGLAKWRRTRRRQRSVPDVQNLAAWVPDYLTGRNKERGDAGKQIIAALSDKLTYKFAAKYCVENPDDTIQDAAEDHWLTLKSWEGIKD